jgi:diguanylate cyclase (GGDEF)-like protein
MTNRRAERQQKLLSSLARIRHGLGAELKLEEISRIIVEELAAMVACSGCAILLIEREEYRILAGKGSLELLEKGQFRADVSGIKDIVETKQGCCSGDITDGPASGWVPAGHGVNSLMRVPVMVSDKVEGIMHLHSSEKNAFDGDDLRSVELMTREMSIAIERYFLKNRVKALSVKDDITGCLNRRKLAEDIEAEIARAKRYEKQLSLLLMDVEWSNRPAASQEQTKSDELLKETVELLGSTVRVVDKFYRYGGSELVIVLPETGKEKALFVAKRLQKIVEEEELRENEETRSGEKTIAGIGIASYPEDGNDREELLRSVETALYRAKRSGKNRVHVFHKTWARSWTH